MLRIPDDKIYERYVFFTQTRKRNSAADGFVIKRHNRK